MAQPHDFALIPIVIAGLLVLRAAISLVVTAGHAICAFGRAISSIDTPEDN